MVPPSLRRRHGVVVVPAGTRPTVDEARRRLELLRERGGSSPDAFTFRERFGPPERLSSAGGS
jgi:hypothetical protein